MDERGSQSLEFALVLPLIGILALLLLHAAVLGGDLIAAQGAARAAARMAAVDGDAAAHAAARVVAGSRSMHLRLDPGEGARGGGGLVTATVQLRSAAFGGRVTVPGHAVMPVEHPAGEPLAGGASL